MSLEQAVKGTWPNFEKSKAHVKARICANIDGLSELLLHGRESREEIIDALRNCIGSNVQSYFTSSDVGLRQAGIRKKAPHFEGSYWRALDLSLGLRDISIDVYTHLGANFTSWGNEEESIAYIRHRLFLENPDLESLIRNPGSSREDIITNLKGQLKGGAHKYFSKIGLDCATRTRSSPHFLGSAWTALDVSLELTKRGINIYGDLGARFLDWADPEKSKAYIRHQLFLHDPQLGKLFANPKKNKAKIIKNLNGKLAKGISSYFDEPKLRMAAAGRVKSASHFKGSSWEALEQSLGLSEIGVDLYRDLGRSFRNWKDLERSKEYVKHRLYLDMPELESLLNGGPESRENAIALLNHRIQGHASEYIQRKEVNLGAAGHKRLAPHFEGSAWEVISQSLDLPSYNIDTYRDLDRDFMSWKDREKSIEHVRRMVFLDIPELPRLFDEGDVDSIVSSLKEKIGTSVTRYLRGLGLTSAGLRTSSPHFQGSLAIALDMSLGLRELGIDIYHDIQIPFTQSHNAEKRREHAVGRIFREYEGLESLIGDISMNKEKIISLLKGKVSQSKWMEMDEHLELSEHGIDGYRDFNVQFYGWGDEEKSIEYARHRLFLDNPTLEETLGNGRESKDEIVAILQNKIGSRVNKYCQEVGLTSGANREAAPHFEGSHWTMLEKTLNLQILGIDIYHDLGAQFMEWRDEEKATAYVRHRIFLDNPGLETLMKNPDENKARIVDMLRKKIGTSLKEYFMSLSIGSAGSRANTPFFEGSPWIALDKALSLYEKSIDLITDLRASSAQVQRHTQFISSNSASPEKIGELVNELRLDRKISEVPFIEKIDRLLFNPEDRKTFLHCYRQRRRELREKFLGLSRLDTYLLERNVRPFMEIRMARRKHRTLSERDYNDFISQVLQVPSEILTSTAITEQRHAHSGNPNFRIRLYQASNPDLESDDTLEAFVKLYPKEEIDKRDLDIAINNYQVDVLRLPSVGKAEALRLKRKIYVKREIGDGFTTAYTNFKGIKKENVACSEALVTPFRNVTTLADALEDSSAHAHMEQLREAIYLLHTRGFNQLKKLPAKARALLRNRRNNVHEGAIYEACQDLDIPYLLEYNAAAHPSLVHNDLHPRNIVLDQQGNYIFIDFEGVSIDAPQLDEARLFAHRDLELDMQDQIDLIEKSAQRRGAEKDIYVEGYHAAVVEKAIGHYAWTLAHPDHYADKGEFALQKDLLMIEEHGTRLGSISPLLNLVQGFELAA
tara:strand:- start:3142 stop:6870 length:3729 start_codon:yes stop_codon:yes gene_type:complete